MEITDTEEVTGSIPVSPTNTTPRTPSSAPAAQAAQSPSSFHKRGPEILINDADESRVAPLLDLL